MWALILWNSLKIFLSIFSRCPFVKILRHMVISDHVLPKVYVKNNCKSHPVAALETTGICAVEFVYILPADTKDNRRWIGGIIHSYAVSPCKNLHNHPVDLSLSYKLSSMVTPAIQRSIDENPISLLAKLHVVKELDIDLVQ